MANTFFLIAKQTLATTETLVEFLNIPQTYTDLKLLVSVRDTNTGTNWNNMQMRFNGLSTDQTWRFMRGYNNNVPDGSVNAGAVETWINFGNSAANTFGSAEIYVFNYKDSTFKPVDIKATAAVRSADSLNAFMVGLWSATAPITSVGFAAQGNFAINSSFYLYGIKKD